jgi:RNA polymerase sigma factor (sigma-70 family)
VSLEPDVRRLARAICRGAAGADPDEAAHLGLVAVWRALPHIDPTRAATARAFVLTHARYAIRKYVRGEKAHAARLADPTAEIPTPTSAAHAEARDLEAALHELAALDPVAHAVVECHLLEEVPIVHVGSRIGLTHSQVRTRYERGIGWMRRRVGV